MIVVTGGAGFIGSNLVASLNDDGITDVVINDQLGAGAKWKNIAKRQISDLVPPTQIFPWLDLNERRVKTVIHLGAVVDTMETNADMVMRTNFHLSLRLLDWCAMARVPFIYASSAATYGDGSEGFVDYDQRDLRPLNIYATSKHLFDIAVYERRQRKETMPPQCVGLKFFNVFGPNEYHKGSMASVVWHGFKHADTYRCIDLFKSGRKDIADGDQKRDFIHVDDTVSVIRWFMTNPNLSGLYNVGTGQARSFKDLAAATMRAMGLEPDIRYVDMPMNLRPNYQYFTEADVRRLRLAGYHKAFLTLEDGISRYVENFLMGKDCYR